ncbi:MAG: HAD family phosphatase [Bdellovibrionota bacterium]
MSERSNRPTRAIIFDMDGVLFMTSTVHARAYAETLKDSAVSFSEAAYPHIAGMRTDQAMQKLCREQNVAVDPAQLEDLARQKSKLAREYLEKEPPVDAECEGVLTALSKSYRLALCSSASLKNVELFLRSSGTEPLFELVIAGDQVQSAKPDPQIYQLALEKLELEPDEVCVVEDSTAGIEAAVGAGARVLGRVGMHSAEDLRSVGASETFESLSELSGLLR